MPTTKFFEHFPKVNYRFGDNELPVKQQDLSIYIDALDQVKEYGSFYMNYQIQNKQRPDHVSQLLYETPEYHWTFYLMNDSLREQGWPLDNSLVYKQAQIYYPNVCITTNGVAFNIETGILRPLCASEFFRVGAWVWFKEDRRAAKILRIDQNLGMVHLEMSGIPLQSNKMVVIDSESAKAIKADPDFDTNKYPPELLEETSIVRSYDQWDAPHHYEDTFGNWVYPEYSGTAPYNMDQESVTTEQSVSYFQRMREENDKLRSIQVLKPEVIPQVVTEFNNLLKRSNR